jgi:hypothetical protein
VTFGLSTSIIDPMDGPADRAQSPPAPALGVLRHRPGFRQAMLQTAETTTEHFRGHRLLNRVLNDRGRFAVGLAVLDMHFGGGTGQPLTSARLQELCVRHGVCSRGRARAVLAVMRAMRLLAAAPGGDRRAQALKGTPAFLQIHRERLARIFAAMEPLGVPTAEAAAALGDDVFLAAFVRRLVFLFEQGFRVLDGSPALRPVAEKAAGMVTLLSLLCETGGVAGERRIVITEMANRYLVSRGHVLEIVRAAEAAGLVRILGDTGSRLEVLPAFTAAFEDFFDSMFAILLEGISAGLAAHRAAGG